MSRLITCVLSIACALPLVGATVIAQQSGGKERPRPMRSAILPPAERQQLLASLARASEYLRRQQQPDGGWEKSPGVTALVMASILRQPTMTQAQKLALTKRALDALVQLQKPDGGIYEPDRPDVTAVAVIALAAAGRPDDRSVIERARQFLVDRQLDEGEGVTPDDKFFGGIGYGGTTTRHGGRADVVSVEYGLQALKAADLPKSDRAWRKAVTFLERSQNNNATNDQRWAGSDGGFVDYPGFSLSTLGELHSTGSASYAGLLGYTYANLQKSDPQVQAALDWVRDNYSVDENPGLGQKTVYYYYMVFAKALQAVGETFITDAKGRRHNWRAELGTKLISLQHPDGYWVNTVPDEMEDNAVVVTAFAMSAIEAILN